MTTRLKKQIEQVVLAYGMNLIFLVGIMGLVASLYLSEVADLAPCDLCWYQRVVFYPIPIVALISLVTKDSRAYLYVLVFAIIGFPMSVYHHLLKVTDIFAKETPFCNTGGECSELDWEMWEGSNITVPLLCALGFLEVLVISSMYLYYSRRNK